MINSISVAVLLCLATAIASPAQEFKTLVSFDGSNGSYPFGALIQGLDGNLYSTTVGFPSGDYPTTAGFYRLTPGGTLTSWEGIPGSPLGAMAQTIYGTMYGTTPNGGTQIGGTIFKITTMPAFAYTAVYDFCDPFSPGGCTDGTVGFTPEGAVILATDGHLYGTTSAGGADGSGTVFKITPQGTLSTLYNFCSQPDCSDGTYSRGALVQATDGNFYGTTTGGGAGNCGTVFKVTSGGMFTTLHSFIGTDGESPLGGLVEAPNGNLYGVTLSGGPGTNCDSDQNDVGTIFMITPAGTLTSLYAFCSLPNCADGTSPNTLIRATDGNFYGSTAAGGASPTACGGYGCGTIFKITPGGTLTTLHDFSGPDGQAPLASLFQATNGLLYGTTESGGANDKGTVFSLNVGLGEFAETLPTSGAVGKTIDILSQGLTGTTAVSFNGIAANFTVVSDTYLTATIPSGATTGFVTVTTPTATLNSNEKFRVTP